MPVKIENQTEDAFACSRFEVVSAADNVVELLVGHRAIDYFNIEWRVLSS